MDNDIAEVIFTKEAIKTRIGELARDITNEYSDVAGTGITVVTVLNGAFIFAGDLIRRLPIKTRIGMITVSSYPGKSTASQGASLESSVLPDLRNRDVLLVDDILETGRTLRLVQDLVRRAEPSSLRTAVLLRKGTKAPEDVPVEYIGFDVDDRFVVGYGLDYDGLYRNLPHIAVLRPELYH